MATLFVTFTSLGRRALPNQWDLVAFVLIFGGFIAVVHGAQGITAPLARPGLATVTLAYANLPYYALRTTLRMFMAIAASLVFTFTYATIAAKSRRAELVLIPLLDILQSVPILGFLSFTVTFFLGVFPGSELGAECAAVFAIFTSQAWNMAFSFYQSLRTVPADLDEVTRGFRLSGWQRFWQLEAPFAMPSLIWNTMMSMSGGWFFVVASEAITVGNTTITLPGIGSYLATAIAQKRIDAVLAAIVAVLVVILFYDQLLFRPIVAWAGKFRVELSVSQTIESSWVLRLLHRTRLLRMLIDLCAGGFHRMALWRLEIPLTAQPRSSGKALGAVIDAAWLALVAAATVWALWLIVAYVRATLTWGDLAQAVEYTLFTMLRVIALMVLATVFWVPVGVWIGLRPRIAQKVQPLAQFLAAFPANVVFPIAVVVIVHFALDPDIWLSPLIIFGTQWYIVFNVIAGASAFPNDLREAAINLRIRGKDWWLKVILPAVFPYYMTGAITASGGSWNASIVAEYVRWGNEKVVAHGIGAYIAQATAAGDYPRIVLGVAVMSVCVVLYNRLLWRPLFGFAERRLRVS